MKQKRKNSRKGKQSLKIDGFRFAAPILRASLNLRVGAWKHARITHGAGNSGEAALYEILLQAGFHQALK
jgi:hypothetical protein